LVKKIKKKIRGNIPIKTLTTEGRFRNCGKCIMCEKYYNENPDYRPPVYDPSQPDPRIKYQERLNTYIRYIKTATKQPSSLDLFNDEYVLACTSSYGFSSSGPRYSSHMHENNSVFITNYGRLYNAQGNKGWYLQRNPYATVDLQTENPYLLTQEYLDIFINLLYYVGDTLLQNKGGQDIYNMKLFYMLVDNFNKYQNMLMPEDITDIHDPLDQFRVGDYDEFDELNKETDKWLQDLEKSPKLSPKFKISHSDFNKSRRTLRKMIGSKKKKKHKKHKKEKKKKKG